MGRWIKIALTAAALAIPSAALAGTALAQEDGREGHCSSCRTADGVASAAACQKCGDDACSCCG